MSARADIARGQFFKHDIARVSLFPIMVVCRLGNVGVFHLPRVDIPFE
jgi:hypothetical protein